MEKPRVVAPAILITGSSLLVGCGGHNYGGSCGSYGSYGSYGSCSAVSSVGAPGIYTGPIVNSTYPQGIQTVALISETGDGRLATADGSFYRLSVNPVGASLSGTYTAYSLNSQLPNGLATSSGLVSGSVTPTALNATLMDSTQLTQTATLTLDNTYYLGASLPTILGNWQYQSGGFSITMTVASDGVLTASDSNGCTYSGNFSVVDPRYDLYAEHHVRTCAGTVTSFDGFAAFFPATGAGTAGTPSELKLLTDDGAGDYVIADFQ
ncbi:MAG: hypothetical protein JSR54_00995 [Proteobacteria bacterium]|nr:hypothetical protein [Pseudomonadota bacterium]